MTVDRDPTMARVVRAYMLAKAWCVSVEQQLRDPAHARADEQTARTLAGGLEAFLERLQEVVESTTDTNADSSK